MYSLLSQHNHGHFRGLRDDFSTLSDAGGKEAALKTYLSQDDEANGQRKSAGILCRVCSLSKGSINLKAVFTDAER
jgi:hypothetical protein